MIGAAVAAICATGLSACTADQQPAAMTAEEARTAAVEMMDKAPESGGNLGDVEIVSGDIVAEFEIEGYGTLKAKLFPDIAPVGVQNFLELAERGYYTGKNLHRVISGFMMQGGSENGDGTGGDASYSGEGSKASTFGIEVSDQARHFYGALCYANAGGQNSTQFYIVNSKSVGDPADYEERITELEALRAEYEGGTEGYEYYNYYINAFRQEQEKLRDLPEKYKEQGGTPSLDDSYTVFGQVVDGFDVIDKIAEVEVAENASGEKSSPVKEILIKSVKVYTAE